MAYMIRWPTVGWVSVGVDHDTAEFAVETLRRWWEKIGRLRYPTATELLVNADGGGSNGTRVRLWKVALQRLADETGLRITVCHFPPGTSKWNKIEHRMFSYISMNWRGKPLISHEVIVNLIASTTTQTGLKIEAEIDTNLYPKGLRVTDEELKKSTSKKPTSMVNGITPSSRQPESCYSYIWTGSKYIFAIFLRHVLNEFECVIYSFLMRIIIDCSFVVWVVHYILFPRQNS